MVMRGAPRAETHGRAPARRAPPLQGGFFSGAPRTSSDTRRCPEAASQGGAGRASVRRAARASVGEKRAV